MDKADQAEKPLRRVGRPRKVVEGADVIVEAIPPMDMAPEYAPPVVLEIIEPSPVEPTVNPFAQAFAKSVWDAQCPTEPRAWRLERVGVAMANKGFSMEGIEL